MTFVCVLYQTELSLGIWASSAAQRRGVLLRSRLIRLKKHTQTQAQKEQKKSSMERLRPLVHNEMVVIKLVRLSTQLSQHLPLEE